MSPRASRLLAGVWAMLPFALLLLSVTLWEAPDRVPAHWSVDLPDGFASGAGVFSVALSVSGFCAVMAALLSLLSHWVPPFWNRWLLALLAGVGAIAAAMYGSTAWGTELAGAPEKVHVVWALTPFVVGLVWGWVGYLLSKPEPVDRQTVIEGVPERSRVVPVRGGDAVSWATSVRSGTMLGTAVFVGVVLTVTTVLTWLSSPWVGLLVAVVSVAATAVTAAWSRVEVMVDGDGLALRSPVLPVPLLRVAADDVVGAEVADLDPMKWGGIGLRWLPGRTAYIVRGGPGIVVHRASGRPLGIEIPEGEEVAAAGARALLGAAGQAMSTEPSS